MQVQSLAVYPAGPVSESVYVPADTSTPVTASLPVAPVMPVVGPSAVSVQSVAAAVPPLSLTTVLVSVSVPGWSSLVIEHVTVAPLATVTVAPDTVPPVQVQSLAVYPAGPVSERVYVPADTATPVTAGVPVAPLTPAVGPVAVSVQSVATAVPPLSFVTVLVSVSVAGSSSFVTAHVTTCPTAIVTAPSVTGTLAPPPSVHVQSLPVYPAGPVSESVYVPADTATPVTAALPVAPLTPAVGPVAVSVQSVATAVPPLSFVTVLVSVSVAGWSSFVIVHVTASPSGIVTTAPVTGRSPVPVAHVQSPAVYPAGPDSESV